MSSMQTSYNIGNGVGTSGDGPWNEVQSTNMLQNTMSPILNELRPHSDPPVPNYNSNRPGDYHGNSIGNHSNQLHYTPYPENVRNGYVNFTNSTEMYPQIINGGQTIGGPGYYNPPAVGAYVYQSPTWASSKANGDGNKIKRFRTKFSAEQLSQLEKEYLKSNYVDAFRRKQLSKMLHLSEKTIKIWFQNRRMKEKKDRVEITHGSNGISMSSVTSAINVPVLMHAGEYQAQYMQPQMLVQPEQLPDIGNLPEVQQLYTEMEPQTDPPNSIDESSDLFCSRFGLDL